MFVWAFIFLAIATISGIFSFKNPSTSTYVAKLVFYLSLLLFLAFLFSSIINMAPPRVRTGSLPI
ncbi:DUF1328 domain-containing protein [Legionella jamestowniensis]|uniref:Transmembrane protein n=1 Tax=Legionella jamestowniensis TaxID=455 RepID=A0A0W0UGB9_9GAMM|nr:DUF1328 domain-containing protein [Legionella jamestowniensis]KTD06732.1 transmembrane protein [Legionella jamestowniensis]OCH97398.1 hypothetical protein A8135_14625 [Legionella jamestowniensis]SFL84013.1 Protein of unknown function [Legionella jamestowniensis DSM 19215]